VAVPGNAAREANRDAAVGHPVQIADGKANPVSPSQPEQAKEQEPKESAQSTDASKPQPVKPKKGWQKDLGRDLRHFPGNLKDDVVGFVDKDNILENALVLGAGLSLAVVSKTTSWDRNVRNTFARRNERFGAATDVATVVGHPGTQFGLAALAYTYGEACKDYRAAETGRQLFEALSINGLLTLGLQITTNQPRPNGERMSFPSGHTSSSFAFAAVLDGVYGPWVGIPAYGVAGFIGAARLDARQHQLSDVLLGAALGYMVGRTVTKVHRKKAVLGFEVDPWVDEQSGGGGIQLRKKF
jgi:membrane-associated phospholipid phosphatase